MWNKLRTLTKFLTITIKFSFHQGTIAGDDSFNQLITDLAFCELASTSQKFTWMNRKEEEDFLMEKLDRAFTSVERVNSYPRYALRNLPIIRLDHGPILLNFEFVQPFKKRPFRFERMWLLHPSCKSVVQKAWHCQITGSRAFQLSNKLSSVKKEFLVWNKEVFGRLEQEIHQKKLQLRSLQNSMSSLEDV